MSWRVIEKNSTDIYNLHGTEDYLLEAVGSGASQPTIMFSRLDHPAISISCKQNLEKDVDVNKARLRGVDLVRRTTGGRSIYLDEHHYILTVVTRKDLSDLDMSRDYEDVRSRIATTLTTLLGVPVSIENKHDFIVGMRKIGGAAHRLAARSVLVHCYLRNKLELENMLPLLKIDGVSLAPYAAEFSTFASSIMNETKRILKPRGYVLVVDWQESFGGTGPKEEDIVDKESAKKLFLNSGFALYNELDAGSYHYALLFKKL